MKKFLDYDGLKQFSNNLKDKFSVPSTTTDGTKVWGTWKPLAQRLDITRLPNTSNYQLTLDGTAIGNPITIDQDKFLDRVEYNVDTTSLNFYWNTQQGSAFTSVDVSALVDIYEGYDPIEVTLENVIKLNYDEEERASIKDVNYSAFFIRDSVLSTDCLKYTFDLTKELAGKIVDSLYFPKKGDFINITDIDPDDRYENWWEDANLYGKIFSVNVKNTNGLIAKQYNGEWYITDEFIRVTDTKAENALSLSRTNRDNIDFLNADFDDAKDLLHSTATNAVTLAGDYLLLTPNSLTAPYDGMHLDLDVSTNFEAAFRSTTNSNQLDIIFATTAEINALF